ncbi:MAG: hypothetical protein QHG99_05940 [Methanomicrobiales archaeon]|nr:hypothetical protein [Methanomicrobiales archaeon]
MMAIETIILPVLMIIIIVELFLMYLMHIRIQQLMKELERLNSRMEITDVELEQLTRNIEEFKKLKIT